MKSLEKLARELARVLNVGGKVCDVRIVSNKIELKYFDVETGNYKKRKVSYKEADNMITSVYNAWGLERKT